MKFSVVLTVFMLSVFTGLALVSLFTDWLKFFLPGNRKYIFAGVLLLYAAIRALRLRNQVKTENHQAK
ncbi:MAG: hypothetical protein IT223_00315 [Crocinitomicaceae bacterium]|nr:hypothetical protein [Crocinitomicaceae bacterium]